MKKYPGKWLEDENIQRITVKAKIYIYILEKKEKADLVIPIEKIKRHAIGWSKEKKKHC